MRGTVVAPCRLWRCQRCSLSFLNLSGDRLPAEQVWPEEHHRQRLGVDERLVGHAALQGVPEKSCKEDRGPLCLVHCCTLLSPSDLDLLTWGARSLHPLPDHAFFNGFMARFWREKHYARVRRENTARNSVKHMQLVASIWNTKLVLLNCM